MANNRLYLTNKLTGEKILLAKYWHGHGWQSLTENDKRLGYTKYTPFDVTRFAA